MVETDEELAELLLAISIISKRLARKITANKEKKDEKQRISSNI